ncbi:MAG: nucleoside-diphosphate kinase [Deltaproteobacteria bacterium]|nr:nucleoside-diphosphate kinase [Deltaproteobacteria bacterium]
MVRLNHAAKKCVLIRACESGKESPAKYLIGRDKETSMSTELTYVVITPYSLMKSRTGNIIARLMSFSGCDLVGIRMMRPSNEFVDEYIKRLKSLSIEPRVERALIEYIDENLRCENISGQQNRCMFLLFEGENAVSRIYEVVGKLTSEAESEAIRGTIRGTYCDFITTPDGAVRYFEPAVLVPTNPEYARNNLELFAQLGFDDSGIYEECAEGETTLVILKPDNFFKHSVRPGNMIDMFSKTGLRIVGARMVRMSAAQGEKFYGFMRDMFKRKLKRRIIENMKEGLNGFIGFEITDEQYSAMADVITEKNAMYEFSLIVKYMTGVDPGTVSTEERHRPGTHRSLALLYRGFSAVGKIRDRLGEADPAKAAVGTIRSDFGQNILQNAAHASDSVQRALHERKIVGLYDNAGNDCAETIMNWLKTGHIHS